MTQNILVTGINGWTGGYLAKHLLSDKDVRLTGLGLRPELQPFLQPLADRINYHAHDLAGPAEELVRLLKEYSFDGVVHLAAAVPSNDWLAQFHTNVLGTTQLLTALSQVGDDRHDVPVLIVSSAAVYGPGDSLAPISEDQPLWPLTPYGVSKVAQEMAALQCYSNEGMSIVRVRPFNLLGPGQPPRLVCSSLARQIVQAERRKETARVQMGRLDTARDFVDVRDAASLYQSLLEHGKPGEVYNCGSGVATGVKEVVDRLSSMATVPVCLETKPELVRRTDIISQRADTTRVFSATGWQPRISLAESLADLLADWRERAEEDDVP